MPPQTDYLPRMDMIAVFVESFNETRQVINGNGGYDLPLEPV